MKLTKPSSSTANTNDAIKRSVYPLFSMPVYHAELGQPSNEVLNFCKKIKYHRYKADNGWVSENKYVLESRELKKLKKLLLFELNGFLHRTLELSDDYTFYINNSWVQKISRGDWTHQHAHENSLISGVYYVQVFEDSGDFTMEKSFDTFNLMPTFISFQFKNFNIFNSNAWTIKPNNGTLLIMGSHMSHSAGVNNNINDRYCIPFNVYVKGKFGVKGGVSDLVLK